MSSGYIKIHRQMLEWEWWSDANTTRLWLYLLLAANYKDDRWQGIAVERGQLVTSVARLSQNTGLTTKQVRLCLERLQQTNEVAIKATNKYSIITICKYENYQLDEDCEGQTKGQAERQTKGNQNDKQIDKPKANATIVDINKLVDNDNLIGASKEASERATTKEIYKETISISKDIAIEKKENADKSARSLEERKQDFYNSLVPYVAQYGKDMIRAFYNYWVQVNPNGKKMLWEKQRAFELERRLVTWKEKERDKPASPTESRQHYDNNVEQYTDGVI